MLFNLVHNNNNYETKCSDKAKRGMVKKMKIN